MLDRYQPVAFRRLTLVAAVLCAIVVVLGAWVRLTAAGLGCPDWPTCYGHITPGGALDNHAAIAAAYPDRPLEYGKALREMVHRYAASTLGILILVLALWAWLKRRNRNQPVAAPLALVPLVILQGILGMLTVTWLLKPTIVTLHLLGGMTTLALLWWTYLSARGQQAVAGMELTQLMRLRRWVIAGLIMLGLQIALGGWTSTNYAALACPDFPTCQGSFWPTADFKDAFVLWRGLGIDYEGGVLDHPARVAIHLMHRIGALFTTVILTTVGVMTLLHARRMSLKLVGIAILVVLVLQVTIGIATVKSGFPLGLATAHNAGAALLLLTLVTLLRYLRPTQGPRFLMA